MISGVPLLLVDCIPLVCISSSLPGTKEYILCKSRTDSASALQIDKALWSPEALGGLPLIIIEGPEFDQTRLLPEFVECAFEMKSTIFDQYSVTWRSKTEVVLQSLTESIILMADSATVHDEERLNYVQSIYKADKESYKDGMKADIRLRDSVICAPLVRK